MLGGAGRRVGPESGAEPDPPGLVVQSVSSGVINPLS
jgi:hypothetical protein